MVKIGLRSGIEKVVDAHKSRTLVGQDVVQEPEGRPSLVGADFQETKARLTSIVPKKLPPEPSVRAGEVIWQNNSPVVQGDSDLLLAQKTVESPKSAGNCSAANQPLKNDPIHRADFRDQWSGASAGPYDPPRAAFRRTA